MFLHSVQTQEQLIAADGLQSFDLAVNPLSVILLHLKPLNETTTLGNFETYLGICGALNRITVLHQGMSILSMSGRDAAALAYFRHGIVPPQVSNVDTDGFRRSVILPIFMGKHAYDPASCFPASRRGELTLEIDFDIADTGYDGLRFAIDTIELLGASPSEFERKVQLASSFTATGINDIELPVGNVCRGLLLFGTTGFTGASPAPTLGRVELLVNNVQVGYGSVDFEVTHMLGSLWGRQPPAMDNHRHRVDATGGAVQATFNVHSQGGGGWENYGWLDLDPTRDDMYSLNLSEAQRFQLQADAETADAFRVVTVEAVRL